MLQTTRKVIKDIMTGKDGESYAFAKIAGVIILAIWLLVSLIAVICKVRFDLNTWGGVTTAIYGTINAAIRGTHVTEPTAYQPTQGLPQDQ